MHENQNIEWKETWRDEYLKWICSRDYLGFTYPEYFRYDDNNLDASLDEIAMVISNNGVKNLIIN